MTQAANPPKDQAPVFVLQTKVAGVTLFEDRAQVVREGSKILPAGRVRVLVEGVSPVLADKTAAASVVSGPPGARVTNVRIRRELRRRAEGRPEDVARLEQELRGVEAERATAGRRLELLDREIEGLAEASSRRLDEVSGDAAWGRAEAGEWSAHLALLAERERGLRDEQLGLRKAAADLDEKAGDLSLRRDALLSPGSEFAAAIDAEVVLDGAGPCSLRFVYLVPCACWRPQHTARLKESGGKAAVAWEMDACVWQCTGEDWEDAPLVFSTQRPSLGTEPPLLSADVLALQDRQEKVAVEARDQAIQTAGLGPRAKREAPEVPGIDDAGASLALPSRHRASVPSDGRPYRVGILAFEAEAATELLAMPERAAAVVRKAVLSNASGRPVLAGPVDLVAGSGHVGRTTTLYVAPGEKFEVGFGPDPELRVHRRAEAVEREKSMLSKWIRTDHAVTLNLSNIGTSEKSFRVTERVPLSEVEQVRITLDAEKTRPAAKPDENGFVSWPVRLPPGGHAEIALRYAVERTKDVVGL
ncbi:MAG: mucoidy inhibitor MuiA family protein [Planctomycetes bacterium]|jgi:uncharacterized protein (TIGR02231 family)|nr:mucoidy inhibitor MuiA family protein [Planctomycetota bacterium]